MTTPVRAPRSRKMTPATTRYPSAPTYSGANQSTTVFTIAPTILSLVPAQASTEPSVEGPFPSRRGPGRPPSVLRARLAAGLLVSVAVAVGLLAAPAWAVPLPAGRQPPPGVTISAVGDTMLGNTPTLPVHPAHYLDKVRGSLDKAQIVFGNLEGTLTTATDSKCDCGSTGFDGRLRPPGPRRRRQARPQGRRRRGPPCTTTRGRGPTWWPGCRTRTSGRTRRGSS